MLFPLTSGLFGPRVLLCWEGHLWWAVLPLSAMYKKGGPFCCLLDQLPEGALPLDVLVVLSNLWTTVVRLILFEARIMDIIEP